MTDTGKLIRADSGADRRAKRIDYARELIKLTENVRLLERISSAQDVKRVQEFISNALNCLPGPATPEKLTHMDDAIYIDWNSIASHEYAAILDELIRLFDETWPLATGAIDPKIIELFSIDHNAAFVLTTLSAIFSKVNATKFPLLVRIFEQCLRIDTWLVSAFIDLSNCNDDVNRTNVRPNNLRQIELVQFLVSAPNRVANYYEGKIPNTFMPDTYCSILLLAFIKALHFTTEANSIQKCEMFNGEFFAILFSRIAIDFNLNRTSKVLPKVIAILANWSADEKYCKLIQQMMRHINRNAMEHVALYILETDRSDRLLGDAVTSSEDWNFVLQTKLPFMMHPNDNRVVMHLIEYLALRQSDAVLLKMLADVARAWSSKMWINSQSLEQHVYLTKLILLGVHRFRIKDSPGSAREIKLIIQKGVRNHMECLQSTIRAIGMVTAEIVMNYLSDFAAKAEDELHFEYDRFNADEQTLITELMAYPKWTSQPQQIHIDFVIEEFVQISQAGSGQIPKTFPIQSVKIETMEVEASLTPSSAGCMALAQPMECNDIDSDDDDLQPYDLTNDKPQAEDKAPRYLIDLRDLLQETVDPDVFEQCMVSGASLITEKLPNDISDIGIQLLELFIGLEKKFYMEHFEQHRFTACVTICCVQPKECAHYLCKEFHTEVGRCSIGKKVFMLDVLSETAKALSKLDVKKPIQPTDRATRAPGKLLEINDSNDTLAEAKLIISERIQRKTRRFAHPTMAAYRNEQINKFANVAGDFFFPLVYGLGTQQLSLSRHSLKHDTDNIVLYSLLHTIATITLAAQNCPIISKIAPEVFELSTLLRFHPEAKVREGVLKMIAAALMATPTYTLQTQFAAHLNELRLWLEQCVSFNIIRGEKDAECREFAKHVLAMCLNALSQ